VDALPGGGSSFQCPFFQFDRQDYTNPLTGKYKYLYPAGIVSK